MVVAAFLPIILGLGSTAQACALSSVSGTYGFKMSGAIYAADGSSVLRDEVADMTLDGRGHLTMVEFATNDGKPAIFFQSTETGTYTVNPDCTGSAEIDFPPAGAGAIVDLMFVLSDGGNTIHALSSGFRPPGSAQSVPAAIHADGERLVQTSHTSD